MDTEPQKIGLATPTREERAERRITEAVLIFYRSLGLKQGSINRLAQNGLQNHRLAMKKAIAHTLSEKMKYAEMIDFIGPVPSARDR